MSASQQEIEAGYRRKLADVRSAFAERAAAEAVQLSALADQLGDVVALSTVRDLAHRLRGTGGMLGFAALSAAAEAVEDAIDAKARSTVVATLVAEMHDAMLNLETSQDG